MLSKKIALLIMIMALLAGLYGCDNEFDEARANLKTNKYIKQEAELEISDFEVSNVEIDYVGSSSYGSYLDVIGIVKNNSNKEASSITLKIYLYQDGNVVLTDEDYVFDLGPYDESSFEFMVDKVKLLTCDEYVVKVTDVF